MLDIAYIREHQEEVRAAITNKRATANIDELLAVDDKRRELHSKFDEISRQRHELARQAKGKKPDRAQITQGKKLKAELARLQTELTAVQDTYDTLLAAVPNIPSADTPIGPDHTANQVLRQVGKKPAFDFKPKPHWQLGEELDLIDSKTAAKVTGSRFAYLKNQAAWLELALLSLAFDTLTNPDTLANIAAGANLDVPADPFVPVVPPAMIRPDVFHRMARLDPKEDKYYLPDDDLYLTGSAEHTLGPLHMDETLAETDLPLRYIGFATAFRREAGSYGQDVHGILRVHQFDKIEMESFTTSDQSVAEQDFLVAIQEYLMQALGLPYQVVLICTGEMGKPDARQLDIEAWLPGQNQYRETHTADLMTDYQARRLKTKVRRRRGTRELVHMNDATVFAIGRTIIALLENYQQADGSVVIPPVLHPYLPFTTIPARP